MITKSVLYICPVLLAFACNQKKNFGADVTTKTSSQPPAASGTPADTNPAAPGTGSEELPKLDPAAPTENKSDPTVPAGTMPPAAPTAGCESGMGQITQVKLLSEGVDLTQTKQTIKYEISLVNCKDGKAVPITNQAVAFDVNLRTSDSLDQDIGYNVLDESGSKNIGKGILESVLGSDLFGNKGNNYAHWTTKSLSYTTSSEKVYFDVIIEGLKWEPRNESDTSFDSYLKIGDSGAVKQTIKILKK